MLFGSSLTIEQSLIMFTQAYLESVDDEAFKYIDSGFFYLLDSATLVVRDNTSIVNLRAQNSAVISASSTSNIHISNNVTFEGNFAFSNVQPSTITLENSYNSTIRDAKFIRNTHHNIKISKSTMVVENCSFSESVDSHIMALYSSLYVKNVRMFDSSSIHGGGYGAISAK